jgi:AcrR family transcriptional regulator
MPSVPNKIFEDAMKNNMAVSKKKRLSADQRRTILLKVAEEVFFERGYAATNLDEIISRAGGSRRNIYTEFGGKEGLFLALVSEHANRAISLLRPEDGRKVDLRAMLLEFAETLMRTITHPSTLGIFRTVIAESGRFSTLARTFFANGPGKAAASLASVLEDARSQGEATVADSSIAASQFIGMLRDNIWLQVILRLRPVPGKKELKKILESAVDIFLYGICKR